MYEHFEVHRDLVPEHVAFVEALAAEDAARFTALVEAHLDSEVRRLLAEPETSKEDDEDRLLAETPDEPQPLDRLDLPEGI
jgi:DNA-binding GntR family transcriptional regulator